MKLLLVILIVLEMYLVMVAISPESPSSDLKGPVRALAEWKKNPTPENEAAWLREKAAFEHKRLLTNVCIYSLAALNTFGIAILIRRVFKTSKS